MYAYYAVDNSLDFCGLYGCASLEHRGRARFAPSLESQGRLIESSGFAGYRTGYLAIHQGRKLRLPFADERIRLDARLRLLAAARLASAPALRASPCRRRVPRELARAMQDDSYCTPCGSRIPLSRTISERIGRASVTFLGVSISSIPS